ncbi:AMP-binding protein [Teredinibacter haidensis]|uniref:AMP-binding protein n=1 Tax=Teredinibacter haidensis TaxID=2731755 RepID=UPI000948F243|nr:AMP-binding protein [Teredinibacter haidensis]
MTPRYKNTLEILEHSFRRYPDKPAYSCLGHTLSYSEIDALSERFASYLRNDLGLQAGDRIAIQLPNILQFPVVLYGAMRAGLVVVNTNPLYTPRETRYQLRDSGAKALVVLSNIAHNAASIIRQTDVETVIVTNIADLHPAPKRWLINTVVKYVKKMVAPFKFDHQISLRTTLRSKAKPFPKPDITPDTLMILQYTGGTTGVSKGAMLSHKNMADNVWQLVTQIPQAFDEGDEIFVACLPLYHIYALNVHALAAFSFGEHNLLIPNPRDMEALVKAIKPFQITVFAGINTLFTALCRYEPFKSVDFSRLKATASGGMALTEDAAKAWENITACKVCEGYGLTETSPVVCSNLLDDMRAGYTGVALAETELKLIDDEGNTVVDEAGELCIRGPQVMQGYWQNEAETKNVLDSDGWLKTGDIAEINADGWVRIVDRKKDMILVSGFNVYPNDIEETICQMPGIIEAAAIGLPDPKCGEMVKLFVVASNDNVTEEMVYNYCRKNLTRYKIPKIIEFRDSLPKSNVGKILRKELRD